MIILWKNGSFFIFDFECVCVCVFMYVCVRLIFDESSLKKKKTKIAGFRWIKNVMRNVDVMWCDVMWCDVMWCDVMWWDVMWCDGMGWGVLHDEDQSCWCCFYCGFDCDFFVVWAKLTLYQINFSTHFSPIIDTPERVLSLRRMKTCLARSHLRKLQELQSIPATRASTTFKPTTTTSSTTTECKTHDQSNIQN